MKIAIVGAGPSGLYLGLLLKRSAPDWQVEIVEQNLPDSTFGFGVVLADTGLQQLKEADNTSYEALCEAMHYNDRQVIVHDETPIDYRLSVRGGAITRLVLLKILTNCALDAGVRIHFGQRIEQTKDLARYALDDADVIVGADGANSVIRRQYAGDLGVKQYSLTNHFAWFGTRRVFEVPALVFRKYDGGHFVAHYYAYNDTMSTFVAECDDATWVRFGMEQMSDVERQALFEKIFSPELGGEVLISNKSIWRQFAVIRTERWSHDRVVLIGDALTPAHFSIGSGTRIAMSDSIALARALLDHGEQHMLEAIAAFEAGHGPQKQKFISASEQSYNWYEQMAEWMDALSPEEFVYQFMTRTGRIDGERLQRDFPELMQRLGHGQAAA